MNSILQQFASLSPNRKLGLLGVIAILLLGIQLTPAWALAGLEGIEGAACATFLCLLPGWLVVYITSRYPNAGSPGMALLLGTGLRMVFVLAGTIVLMDARPGWGIREFYAWLLFDYFAFLAIETAMVVPVDSNHEMNSQSSSQ